MRDAGQLLTNKCTTVTGQNRSDVLRRKRVEDSILSRFTVATVNLATSADVC